MKVIDWSRMPRDGSLMVEVRFPDGEPWRTGRFLGVIGVGSLAVRLLGKEWVDEFSHSRVRLPQPKTIEQECDLPVVITPDLAPKISSLASSLLAAMPIEKQIEAAKEGNATIISPPPGANPLDMAEAGDYVWAEDDDGEMKDGKFQSQDAVSVLVLVDGESEPRRFPREKIQHAQTAKV